MPQAVYPEQMNVVAQGTGWRILGLADARVFGAPAMVARRWVLEPGARGPVTTQGDTDQLLYVIQGSGRAQVDDRVLPLEPESVLWVEPGETYRFEAGPEGLQVLQGFAPGGGEDENDTETIED